MFNSFWTIFFWKYQSKFPSCQLMIKEHRHWNNLIFPFFNIFCFIFLKYKSIYTHIHISIWLSGKESACNAGDTGVMGLIPGSGRSPGGGNDNPLHYPCWKTRWIEEPVRLPSMAHRVRHNWAHACAHPHTPTHPHIYHYLYLQIDGLGSEQSTLITCSRMNFNWE